MKISVRNVVRQLEDSVLIDLLRTDPERGLDAAVRQYGGLCKAVIVRILGEGADAEECLADTFAALWQHAGEYRPEEGSLKLWLCAIARNQAVNLYRKRRRQPFIPEEESSLGELADDGGQLERREDAVLLREALMELSELDRRLVIWRYFYGESVKGAAEKLGITPKYAENRLYKSRQRLKKLLEQRGVTG